jgi:serine/threonine protein kinase
LAEAAPQLLNQRYIIIEPLGEGGTAEVWRAWDKQKSTWCAVKILRDRYVQQERALRRFLDEGSVMLNLGHRNVIEAWDLVRSPQPFLVMEIAEGGSLKDWVDRHGKMPPRLAVDVAIQVCKGIGAANKIGVIHRDIKPHNILLNRRGQCKVTDFGIARIIRPDGSTDVPDAATGTQNAMGTLGYMAPEQRTDPRSADVRADVYGIGATLYTLLTGRVVTNLFIAEREPELLGGIPEVLVPVLMRATGYKPDQRYDSVADLAKALFDLRNELPEDQPRTPALAPDLPPEAPAPVTPPPSGARADSPALGIPPDLPPELRRRALSPPGAMPHGHIPVTPTPAEFRAATPAQVDGDDTVDEPERTRPWVVVSAVVLLLASLCITDAAVVRTAAQQAEASRDDFRQALELEAMVVDRLARLGADRSTLEPLLQSATRASGPVETLEAGKAFVSELQRAAEVIGPRNDKDAFDTRNAIERIEEELEDLDESVDKWRGRSRFVGRPAVALGLAPSPDQSSGETAHGNGP